ncbi:MAG: ergothioneine biosynthesis protein EgtB [Thermoleophilia bacterium]
MEARRASTGTAATDGLRQEIAAALARARAETLDLIAPLDQGALTAQHSPLMSPIVWDVAHVGWYEETWLLRRLAGRDATDDGFDDVYDAFRHGRAERPDLPLLAPDVALSYLAEVRREALEVLAGIPLDDDDPLLADGFAYGLVLQHEHQHQETICQTLQLSGLPLETPPPAPARENVPAGEVLVDGGSFLLGAPDEPWAYDNERDAHEVELPPFLLDRTLVTNAAFAAFVADGGYDDERHWHPAGWALVRAEALRAPLSWSPDGAGGWTRTRFGRVEPVPADEPVQHVSWYEADAFARWAGKRLPTEPEWEKAATWDAATGRKRRFPWGDDAGAGVANLGRRQWQPAPAGAFPDGASACGVHQLVGDVWEWTSSDFGPYPGFAAFPYREYSEAFFGDGYKVLRGGSWATHPAVARATFRNWDHPIRRQLFAGFRCARDA